MSHESILADLGALSKPRVTETDPREQIQLIMSESDRAYIILHSATLESLLLQSLEELMTPLNSEERAGLFKFNGPAGTFASRIWLAQGLGMISRKTRKELEIIKGMRNASAHAHCRMDFDTPAIKAAVAQFFRPRHREDVLSWNGQDTREIFGVICTCASSVMHDPRVTMNATAMYELMKAKQTARQSASPDIPPEGSSPESPPEDQK